MTHPKNNQGGHDKFLLIMPSYNQAHYIGYAIESILAQTDPDWDLWIIDNSTDNTPEVVSRYQDSRIQFHHIPKRMDPGTCLNWALERTHSRHFSYVHTDNNLAPNYVALMRCALEKNEHALAYCELRVINDSGAYTGVYKRGEFDLPRLTSLSPLGVPFSATTKLAQEVGGFSTRDVADDVLFCLQAYGRAHYVHIPDALVDYRLHQDSRTTEHGGAREMERSFLRSFARAQSELTPRGIDLADALRQKTTDLLKSIQLDVEDFWYRRGRLSAIQLKEPPSLHLMWEIGLFKLPGMKGKPFHSLRPRKVSGTQSGRIGLWKALRFKLIQRKLRKQLKVDLQQLRLYALPWAYLTANPSKDAKITCVIDSNHIVAFWLATMLRDTCEWDVRIAKNVAEHVPSWLRLPLPASEATSNSFLLRIEQNCISLSRMQSNGNTA